MCYHKIEENEYSYECHKCKIKQCINCIEYDIIALQYVCYYCNNSFLSRLYKYFFM